MSSITNGSDMRICPRKSDFYFFKNITRLPKKIVKIIMIIAIGTWRFLSRKPAEAKRLTPGQVKLLNDIKQHKVTYQARDMTQLADDTPEDQTNHSLLRSTSSRDLTQPIFHRKGYSPLLEELRATARTASVSIATSIYNQRFKGYIEAIEQKDVPKEINDLIVKASPPLMAVIAAVLRNYKGSDANMDDVHTALVALVNYLHRSFKPDLTMMVDTMLAHNTARIADQLVCRALDLLNEIPYQETIDKLGHVLCDHVNALSEATKQVDSIVLRAKRPFNKHDSEEEKRLLSDCKKRVETPEAEYEYRTEKLVQAFTDSNACHDTVRELNLGAEDELTNHVNRIFSELTDELLNVFLPKRSIRQGNEQIVVGGLNYLWQTLSWPPEFGEIKAQLMEILRMVLPESGVSGIEKIEEKIAELVESCALSFAEDRLRKFMTEKIREACSNFLEPAKLRSLLALRVLPRIDSGVIPGLALLYLTEKIDDSALIYQEWIKDPAKESVWLDKLVDLLFDTCVRNSKRFQHENDPITKEDFSEQTTSLFKDIYRTLSTYQDIVKREDAEFVSELDDYCSSQIVQLAELATAKSVTSTITVGLTNEISNPSLARMVQSNPHRKTIVSDILNECDCALVEGWMNKSTETNANGSTLMRRILKKLQKEPLALSSIKEQLRVYETYTSVNDEGAPPYGSVAVKALFDVGKFEMGNAIVTYITSTGTAQDVIKGIIQPYILGMLKPFRDNPNEAIGLVIEQLNAFINGQSTQIHEEEPPHSEEEIEEILQDEIQRIAFIVDDILKGTIQTKLNLGFIAKRLIGGSLPHVEKLESVISNCLNALSCSGLTSTSLALKIHDIFKETLREAKNKVDARELAPLAPDRVQHAA